MDELLARHKKEVDSLQSRIGQKKRNATKKTRRGVNSECDRLEKELQETHRREIAELDGGSLEADPPADDDEKAAEEPAKGSEPEAELEPKSALRPTGSTTESGQDGAGAGPRAKRNRQKERLARRAAELDAIQKEAIEEAKAQPDLKQQERDAMKRVFEAHRLREVQIRPDGHCLYSSFADQVAHLGLSPAAVGSGTGGDGTASFQAIRAQAADFLLSHPDDFAPFLEEALESHAEKVRSSSEWGSHLELLALARAYRVEINLVQGSGRIEKISGVGINDSGGSDIPKQVWLAYSRHLYGLGEHYNSLRVSPA